jgi:lipoprotein-releasing system permease protein
LFFGRNWDFAGYIARRYLRSRRHSRFLSRGSVTAIVGIAIGVAVLNVTLAVMNGFHAEMRRIFVENMPMVSILNTTAEGFTDLGAVMDSIATDPEVTGTAPFIRQVGLGSTRRNGGQPRTKDVVVWGIEPDLVRTVLPIDDYLSPDPEVLGDLEAGSVPTAILGVDLANRLRAAMGDTVILTTVNEELDLANIEPESIRVVVKGYFDTGMYEFDSRFVYLHLDAARAFFHYADGGATMIGVRVADVMTADRTADRIEDHLGLDYFATDWMAMNSNLFQWIKLEKVIMILLLGMIILIAGFNIIGILTMMVGERRREIGILLAMGARRGQMMGIFLINGLWLGVVGVFFGTVVGLAGVAALKHFGLALPGDVYFVDTVPVLLQWGDVLLVSAISLGMALLAGLWPSWEASNLKPMEIIRYT